jgi:hypothetical protein
MARRLIETRINRARNLRFKIAFTETNIRWLAGAKVINEDLIARHKASIAEAEAELAKIPPPFSNLENQ